MSNVTVQDVRDAFYEFSHGSIDDSIITSAIETAESIIDESFYGDKTDKAVLWLAAHFLSQTQYGQENAQSNQSETSVYKVVFDQIRETIPAKLMVL